MALVACIATIFSLGALPIGSVPASAQLVAAGSPVDASTGCPRALPEYALNDLDFGPGLRCVSWPVSMKEQVVRVQTAVARVNVHPGTAQQERPRVLRVLEPDGPQCRSQP